MKQRVLRLITMALIATIATLTAIIWYFGATAYDPNPGSPQPWYFPNGKGGDD